MSAQRWCLGAEFGMPAQSCRRLSQYRGPPLLFGGGPTTPLGVMPTRSDTPGQARGTDARALRMVVRTAQPGT
jgi:hypothetical protein